MNDAILCGWQPTKDSEPCRQEVGHRRPHKIRSPYGSWWTAYDVVSKQVVGHGGSNNPAEAEETDVDECVEAYNDGYDAGFTELAAKLEELAAEAEQKGTHLREIGMHELKLVGNAYVGMSQRIRAIITDTPSAMPADVLTCKHCAHPIKQNVGSQYEWTHFPYPPDPGKGWQGLRCPVRLTTADPA